MTFRIIFYALVAMGFQVGMGYLTGMGQGSMGLLAFIILVELDPNFSFRYLVQKLDKEEQHKDDERGVSDEN